MRQVDWKKIDGWGEDRVGGAVADRLGEDRLSGGGADRPGGDEARRLGEDRMVGEIDWEVLRQVNWEKIELWGR
jgi:hypothetical protein